MLTARCTHCHGATTKKAGLDLSTIAAIESGSESGPIISRETPGESRLLEVVINGEMPPEGEGEPLSSGQIDLIRVWITQSSAPTPSTPTLNQHDVLPILLGKCAECHGRQLQEGKLDIRNRDALLQGGTSGPAIIPGEPNSSRLVQRIKSGEMPPREQLAKFSVKPVSDTELAKIEQWIASGANWIDIQPDSPSTEPDLLVSHEDRKHWAFQVPIKGAIPRRSTLPGVADIDNPLDAFVARQLDAHELSWSPRADRNTLIRRLNIDLLGLPPSAASVQAFQQNGDPRAYDQLVDTLLASPAYGERWGQHWLDLAGYADSEGVQHADPVRPHAYRFRDYVIQSWNRDKGYDRFLLEQIAGDELADYENSPVIDQEMYDNLVATGFLRMTSDGTFAGITGFLPNRLDVIDDQLRVLSSAVMGITLRCARCHTHKFDPLPHRDYYRMVAIFKGAMDEFDWLRPLSNPSAGKPRYLPFVTTKERSAWQQRENAINARLDKLRAQQEQLESTPGETQVDARKQLERQIAEIEQSRDPEPMIRALWDQGEPSPTYLLRRGDYQQPTRLVGPGVPAMLTDGKTPFLAEPPWPGAQKTGNRLALAKWLVRPDHPLTARVLVNRIWKHHFGRGLQEPLDDFGKAAGTPTHPELLDWLAVEFVEHQFSIKWLQRLIVTSATYCQSSDVQAIQRQRDPDNLYLSRMPLRRLDAEVLHDSLVAVAGRLDRSQFGAATAIEARDDGLVTAKSEHGAYRRAIYVQKRRTQRLTILDNFDRPRMSPNCIDRPVSNVAPQALHLLNNRTVRELSVAMADRIVEEVGSDPLRQIDQLFLLAIGREPTPEQQQMLVEALHELQSAWTASATEHNFAPLANLCHAVMNSAAFLYVD